MNKPFSVARDDFETELRGIVLESGLPASVTADILEKMLTTVQRAAAKQLAREREAYEKSMKEEVETEAVETAKGDEE